MFSSISYRDFYTIIQVKIKKKKQNSRDVNNKLCPIRKTNPYSFVDILLFLSYIKIILKIISTQLITLLLTINCIISRDY